MSLVHEPFRTLAGLAAAQVGMPNAPALIYARDLVDEEPAEVVERKAREVVERAAAMLLAVGR
ncbi:MAG: hypothetical protein HY691_08875 [Chloroflexi bacterium]|nr:hypothetical protein [Chloroflexota bacterium]